MNASHTVEWYRSVHMLTWYCDIGHDQRQLFSDKADYEAHTRASHGNLTTSQLIARTKRSKNVASREPFTCPLCECVPQKLTAVYPQQRLQEVSGLLGKHVASHIKSLSLLSFRLLPHNDEGEDIHENSSNLLEDMSMDIQHELSGSEQRVELSRDAELSESFEGIPVTDRHTNEAISIEDITVHATPELADSELWTFLPAFDYLNKEQDKPRQRKTIADEREERQAKRLQHIQAADSGSDSEDGLDISEDDSKQGDISERITRDIVNVASPADSVHRPSPKLPRNSSIDRKETQSLKRSPNKPRKSKGTPAKVNFAWVHEGPQEGNTEDEGSVANEEHSKKLRWAPKHSDSRRNSNVDVKRASKAATTIGTRRQANGTIGTVYSGNKIGHIKKDDGVPLWRKDIQYEFLRSVFEDKTAVFTRVSDGEQGCNFADIYIDAIARSSKTSKILKDKVQSDRAAAQNMAIIGLLMNVGRINTTLNFFPEIRAQLRTYHSIPALQAHQDSNAYKQLQDTPRLKSILKGASEDNMDEPRTIEAIQAHPIPRTNPVNLIFVLSQHAPKTSELHFSSSVDFFDLVTRCTISSKSRSRAFLWLMWWYLQSNFTKEDALNNPFGPGTYKGDNTDGVPMHVPEFEYLTEAQVDAENIDPPDEITFGEEKQRERKRILKEDAENKPLKRVKGWYDLTSLG
jgi:hypothetical protein